MKKFSDKELVAILKKLVLRRLLRDIGEAKLTTKKSPPRLSEQGHGISFFQHYIDADGKVIE